MSQYFSNFPTAEFNGIIVTNVCARVDIINKIKDNISLFSYTLLKNGERPEDVAYTHYGDTALYWIVLYMNDIVDPFKGWLLSDSNLLNYVSEKYGEDKIYAIHHYETTDASDLGEGVVVNFGTSFSRSVTNYSYEQTLNEQKRKIKILNPRYVSQIVEEFQKELQKIV